MGAYDAWDTYKDLRVFIQHARTQELKPVLNSQNQKPFHELAQQQGRSRRSI